MGQFEVLDQLLVGRCFLQRRQVLAMEILHKGAFDQPEVVGVAHDRRDDREPCTLRGAPATLAGHQLVRAVPHRTNQHRLQHADLADRRCQLAEGLLVEVDTGLVLIGDDAVDREIDEAGRISRDRLGLRRNQSAETFTQTAESSHD